MDTLRQVEAAWGGETHTKLKGSYYDQSRSLFFILETKKKCMLHKILTLWENKLCFKCRPLKVPPNSHFQIFICHKIDYPMNLSRSFFFRGAEITAEISK